MIYPGSTPDFRIFVKLNGSQVLQLRYINISVGYAGHWKDISVVHEQETIEDDIASTEGKL
jgi:hypothetical protein